MKRHLHIYAFLVLLICSSNLVFSQQISVDSSISLDQLILNNLVEGCVEISSITSSINGSAYGFSSYAYFDKASSNFPFQNGIMLSTGNAVSGGNSLITPVLSEGTTNWGTDPDLETALIINNTLNATSIEFDFVSATNLVQFNYLLASEEYFGYNPCQYSDGFAFLIKQTGSAAPYQNIALIPSTLIPVNTNTIHDEIFGIANCPAQNEQYFDGYGIGDTNYNGRTVPLTATATIIPYVQYHIKLIIADQTDLNFDSAVFIEAINFDNLDLGDDIVTCLGTVTLNADIQNPQATYAWYWNNNLINGETDPTLNAIQSGTYRIEISVPLNSTVCLLSDEIQVTLNSEPIVNPIPDFELCNVNGNETEVFDLQLMVPEIFGILPSGSYNLSFYPSETEARSSLNAITTPFSNTSNPQIIYVAIENVDTGCFSYAPFNLIVNPLPNITDPTTLDVCDNDATPNGITDFYLTDKDDEITSGQPNLTVSYHFTQAEADNGNNAIDSSNGYVNASSPNSQLFYVRVINDLTGCVNTTTLNVIITNSPIVNRDTQYLDACDTDHDGFASFNLTQVIADVLQGLNGVTTTFHLTFEDAESGNNPILDETNFLNTNPNVQTIFIRVIDNITLCPTVVPIETHTNLLLTGTDLGNFAICDDASNDGIGEFFLNAITTQIVNDLPNIITITYYETQSDLDNNTNALDPSVPHTFNNQQTLFINIVDTVSGCSEKAEINLLINPLLFFPAVTLQYCDDDDDGTVDVDLHSLDEIITGGNADFDVFYYLDENGAKAKNLNEISFFLVSGTQTFYARIENIATTCHTVNNFDVEVVSAPIIMQPSPFIICDNDQDGFSIINLNDKIIEIVPDTTGLTISFFTDMNDLESGTNPILNPSAFNTNTQDIFVKIKNTTGVCYSVATINIIVNTKPIFTSISDYEICENDGDETADFLFSEKDNEILNGQTDKEVLYFEDANYTIPIDKNILYQNTSPSQTIYIRVQNIVYTGCYGDSSFTILVSSYPAYNTAFNDYSICDDSSNDGKNLFDLNEKIAEISQGDPNLDITFHSIIDDAENGNNPMPLQYTNDTNPQTLYVRIQRKNSICYVVEELGIIIFSAPNVTLAAPFVFCDTDFDGITTFNLNDADFQINERDINDFTINYFENEQDVEDVSKEITNPSNYNNLANPQTVYIKVTNIYTNCYSIIPLELIVNSPPETNAVGTIKICDNGTNTYDLSQVNSMIVNNSNIVTISYHIFIADAENNINPLVNIFNYTSNFYTFYARIEDPNTGCFVTPSFNLQINPNPVAYTPTDLEACDDDYDGFFVFDLSQQKNSIIGLENPADFSVTYYTNTADAENGDNPLNNLHAAFDGEIIYARMEDNIAKCYDTTSFSIIINPLPIINIGDIVPLCLDDLPLIISAETNNVGDTYLWSTGETTSIIQLNDLTDISSYTVTVTTPNSCVTTKLFEVIESIEPTINFIATVDFADPNSITVDVSGNGNYVFILDDGEPQTSNVFDNVTIGPHVVTVKDLNGCKDVSQEVVVIDVPKFVTPNGDGDFDTWHITGVNQLTGTTVYIYDRYGKLLKTLPSTAIGWDGTFNGQNMPSDDYWYVANVFYKGDEFQLKGHFALKR